MRCGRGRTTESPERIAPAHTRPSAFRLFRRRSLAMGVVVDRAWIGTWIGVCLTCGIIGCGEPPREQVSAPLTSVDSSRTSNRASSGSSPAPAIEPSGLVASSLVPSEPFELIGTDGQVFDSRSLLGKVWVGSIFFANCPGTCFRENQSIADVLVEIDDPDFLAVSVTCDPENDSPEALARYAERFQANPARWKFLTGDIERIKEVAGRTLFLPAEVGVHSERGVVFDRQGRLRGSYLLLQEDRVALLKKLVRELLAEPVVGSPNTVSDGGQP